MRWLCAAAVGLKRLIHHTRPAAAAMLRKGSSADLVLATSDRPRNPLLRGHGRIAMPSRR